MRILSLAVALSIFWLGLSGHYTPILLIFGVLSVALCLYLAHQMGTIDQEGLPIHLLFSTLLYMPWLVLEILKASWDVTKVILNPKCPIAPSMLYLKASQKTGIGVNIYGNSITLTPGTLTVEARGQDLVVHALTRQSAADLESGEMDRRVSKVEGAS